MARNITMNQLTEGIRDRHLGAERNRLVEKWTRTGLLRGMQDVHRETMSQLLENQAAQLLREANTLGSGGSDSGQIDGFSNIAFPIVRRVFGGLVANDLVSIQPMSLPSGLLFYLDYSYGSDIASEEAGAGSGAGNQGVDATAAGYAKGDSLYGSPGGASVRTGSDATGGQYDLAGSGYTKVHNTAVGAIAAHTTQYKVREGDAGTNESIGSFNSAGAWTAREAIDVTVDKNLKLLQYDPQIVREITENSGVYHFVLIQFDTGTATQLLNGLIDRSTIKSAALVQTDGLFTPSISGASDMSAATDMDGLSLQGGKQVYNLRRLNAVGTWDSTAGTNGEWTFDAIIFRRKCVLKSQL